MSHSESSLPVLDESLLPMETFFEETEGDSRFVTVLSPTCPACVDGADAVRETVLSHERNDVETAIVWIPMLDDDTEKAIERSAAAFAEFDVVQFVDSDRVLGRHIAHSLGGVDSVAWDIYLFYGSDARWENGVPTPDEWVHQLGSCSWAPADRYRCGDALKAALAEMVLERES